MRHKIFLIVLGTVFLGLAAIFMFLPRSKFSELERRELATFPEFTWDKLTSGHYTDSLSFWFSDSEPFRDKFMEAHMRLKDKMGLHTGGDDAVTFHADAGGGDPGAAAADPIDDGRDIQAVAGVNADGTAKIAAKGIIVTGQPPTARALMVFGGGSSGKSGLAEVANKYQRTLGSGVKMYVMVVPLAVEFYCPDKVKGRSKSQLATIRNIYSQLAPGVRAVDVYTPLGQHASEDIYLRTDHHWAPLGAYYAARKLCQVAGVPMPDLKDYDKKVVHNFVGTMYGYSKDINVKRSPEDFVYYTPKNNNYTTTYVTYKTNKNYGVTSASAPYQGSYFHHFKDGSGAAYCTFMGSDQVNVKVNTWTKNGRRILIIKDSYGNAVPGYLFGSFEQVHVIDFRYFPGNIQKYVKENGITDVVFIFNSFNAYSGASPKLDKLLSGAGAGQPASTPVSKSTASPARDSHPKKESAPSSEEAAPTHESNE